MIKKKPAFYDDGTPFTGMDTIRAIQGETDTVLMSFSCGKDSIAAWVAIRPYFKRVVPYYLWLIPDLEFVNDSLQYYEEYFGTHIMRLPHPGFWRMLNNFVWQSPERCQVIEAANMPNFDYDDINKMIANHHGLPDTVFTASGVRAVDSPVRWASMKKSGPINWERRYFYPVWDLRKDDLVKLIQRHHINLPVDYWMFGRSFDGIDYRFLAPLREHYPRDFEKILEWFPMARLEIMRYEQ